MKLQSVVPYVVALVAIGGVAIAQQVPEPTPSPPRAEPRGGVEGLAPSGVEGLAPSGVEGLALSGVEGRKSRDVPRAESRGGVEDHPELALSGVEGRKSRDVPRAESRGNPRRLTIDLTVADPADLKVAEGDPIQPGQLLADRGRERQRLEAQREQLQLAVERLQQSQITPPLPPAQPSPIAEPTYLEEQAAIERAQAVVTAAEWALANKRQEIAYLLELPNLDPLILEHEQAQLQQLQHDHTLAVRDYQLAMGRRSSVAYRHGVTRATAAAERNQAMLAYQQQWSEYEQRRRDKDYQLTQTQLKLDEIDYAISTLAVVRSPYAGRIRRVRWLGQKSDGRLGVELTLLVRDGAGAAVPGKPSVVPGAADGVGD